MAASGSTVAALLVALATACTRFVEPNPPVLVRGERTVSPAQTVEPLVVGVVLDLHVADPAACDAIYRRALGELRGVALSSGAFVRELQVQDLAPGCVRDPRRTVSLGELDTALRAAESDLRSFGTVRAVLLYVNNLDSPVGPDVAEALRAVRDAAVARGAPPALVYGLVCPRAAESWAFDATVSWSHAADEPMWWAVRTRLSTDLPLVSRAGWAEAPLLDPAVFGVTLALKICRASPGVTIVDCPRSGAPCPVQERPAPRVVATFAPLRAVPRSSVMPAAAVASYEACTGRCDRFVELGDRLARWGAFAGCSGGAG